MTAITLGTGTQLPSSINELTCLIVWNALKIDEIQPKEQRTLYENFSPQKIIDYRTFPTRDYGIRMALQVIVKLSSDWKSTSRRLWEKAQPTTIDSNSPEAGPIVPYYSPANPTFAKPFSQPQLPPLGGTTPPNGFRLQPNTLTNIKPNQGTPIDFKGNQNGAKGNANGGGGGGGAAGGAALAGAAARVGGAGVA